MGRTINFSMKPEDILNESERETWSDGIFARADGCREEIEASATKLRKRIEKEGFTIMPPEYHNIIAFTGDRGTGKTTAMLKYQKKLLATQKDGSEIKYKELPMVDPSRMTDGESLLALVIAGIYEKLKDATKDAEQYSDFYAKNKDKIRETAGACCAILRKIRVKAVPVTDSLKDFPDPHDYMEDFSETIKLREKIYELIQKYLSLYEKAQQLLIPIDDLDTNISSGFEIAREIHHYLSVPNVIILMSLKLEQLSDLIEQRYIKSYEEIIKQHNRLAPKPTEMAVK